MQANNSNGWRVVYGETLPTWEKTFATKREAEAFAKKHRSFGDIIFSVARVVPGEPPQSITAAIDVQLNHPVLAATTTGYIGGATARAYAKRRTLADASLSDAPPRDATVLFGERPLTVRGFMWRRGEVKAVGFFCRDRQGTVFFGCYGSPEDSEKVHVRGRVR